MMRIISKKQDSPMVLVTGPDKKLKLGWWSIRNLLHYYGLRGQYVSPRSTHFLKNIQGVIISGGDDIHPEHYGLTGDGAAKYDRARDKLELTVVRQACELGVPLFGICRGAQLINIALGGSLHSDIRPLRKKTPNRSSLFPTKRANLIDKSYLKGLLGRPSIRINSLHHQAIDRVADAFVVAAKDRDDFIQAIELKKDYSDMLPFIIGVQWHPEYMPYDKIQRKLFKGFVKKVVRNTAIEFEILPFES